MEIKKILSTWSQMDCVKFAVWCAKRVQHINTNPRVAAAIQAAEKWILDPSEAAYADAYAAAAAYAADDAAADAAAYAAYAAAAYADAYAAAAAYAADDAYAAAAYAAKYDLTPYDLLNIYLSEMIIDATVSV
jgi:hypothetical protein